MNLENKPIKISFVTVTYNSASKIEQLIQSIFNSVKDVEYEILIVDNNSQDDTVERIKKMSPEIRIISNPNNVGFASANNQAFKIATGNFILIINPDIQISDQTNLRELCVRLQMDDNIGIIATRLQYADGSIQESARGFPNPLAQLVRGLNLEKHFKSYKFYNKFVMDAQGITTDVEVDWVIGAFMLIKKSILEEVNYFDSNYFMYYEDADLCIRLRKKGYKTLYTPTNVATHSYQRDSAKKPISWLKMLHVKSILRFYLKHSFYLFSGKK